MMTPARAPRSESVVQVRELTTVFGEKVVHDRISLEVRRGEIFAVVGGSGSGKSTLMREMALLQRPSRGSIRLVGQEVTGLVGKPATPLRCRIGVLFQQGALFSSMTVMENVAMPLREHTRLSPTLIEELVLIKLDMVGLAAEVAVLYPSQLSGGMRKRVGIARALALDPELLFLDEPTSGLDPVGADGLDNLVLRLKASLDLTVVMVTHDMDSLWRVADRVVLLGEARIQGSGTMAELHASNEPALTHFFGGPRGRAAQAEGCP